MTDIRETIARHIRDSDWSAFFDAHESRIMAANIIAALAAAGLAIVPEEPTDPMELAGGNADIYPSVYMGGPPIGSKRRAARIWECMIQAAKDAQK